MPLKEIIDAQARWAQTCWPGHTGRRAPCLEDNLFGSLSEESRADFARGSGGELGRKAKPGKMSSLRSSSALSYNVFGPWRGLELTPLASALGTTVVGRCLRFEYKCRHGLRSTPPNLDVMLDADQPRPLGIECKFTEPYGKKPPHASLDPKYFARNRRRWMERGLPNCQLLAEGIGAGVAFSRLCAGQLLKHILGLAYFTKNSPRLFYVWFDTGCREAQEHRNELSRFIRHLESEVEFKAITYQDFFRKLRLGPEPVPGYYEYLSSRYFAA